ncbi:HD domain-containing protein [Actinoplanes rectilineatus]|uniref:HD domain-containing protein n=1 Tax=Actinoplanes rectilineatus TaxID=113571 RepID=UPI0005F2B8FD|nr:HD domain-containing protein [Actinoplanes rectilineatus]
MSTATVARPRVLVGRAADARDLAESLIGDSGDRWRHTAGVAARAAELADRLDLDPDVLVSAAWLHDIGYAASIALTGFHPLDGAVHVSAEGWTARIAGLVAYHSGARFVGAARGFGAGLAAFPDERTLMSDALTYADQTVGPRGDRVDQASRYAEVLLRHGPCSWNAKVDPVRGPHLRSVAARVEHALVGGPAMTPRR